MSDALDLSRLSALAQQATPGPWAAQQWTCTTDSGCAAVGPLHECGEDGDESPDGEAGQKAQADAEFIAACSPDVILHLVQRLERIEAWATNSVAYSQTQDPFLRGHAGACQEVRELLELKAKP